MKPLFFVLTIFFLSTLSAQTLLKGRVVAKNEKETIAISGANIFWLNTAIGTISNEEGAFETRLPRHKQSSYYKLSRIYNRYPNTFQ